MLNWGKGKMEGQHMEQSTENCFSIDVQSSQHKCQPNYRKFRLPVNSHKARRETIAPPAKMLQGRKLTVCAGI